MSDRICQSYGEASVIFLYEEDIIIIKIIVEETRLDGKYRTRIIPNNIITNKLFRRQVAFCSTPETYTIAKSFLFFFYRKQNKMVVFLDTDVPVKTFFSLDIDSDYELWIFYDHAVQYIRDKMIFSSSAIYPNGLFAGINLKLIYLYNSLS